MSHRAPAADSKPPIAFAVSRVRLVLAAAAACALAITTARLGPGVRAPPTSDLPGFHVHERELQEFWSGQPEEMLELRAAIERARKSVVRARVVTYRRYERGVTMTQTSKGSGFIVGDGRFLVLSAHQGERAFFDTPHAATVSFTTYDGHELHASLIAFAETWMDEPLADVSPGTPLDLSARTPDWALCVIHNPFDLPVHALEFGDRPQRTEPVAVLGYPWTRMGDACVGLAHDSQRPVRASPPGGLGPWPPARALAIVTESGGHDLPPGVGHVDPTSGMSGGPVIDRRGRAIAIMCEIVRTTVISAGAGAEPVTSERRATGVTYVDVFRGALEAARARRATDGERLVDRIVSVAKGLFDPQETPVSYHLSGEERRLAGLDDVPEGGFGVSETVRDAARKRFGDATEVGGRWSISSFQSQRWLEDRLREVVALGPAALADLRAQLDAELGPPWDWSFAVFQRDYLLDACENVGVTVGLDTLRPFLDSPSKGWRKDALGHLPTIAEDVHEAFWTAVEFAETDDEEEVRTAAKQATHQLLTKLRTRVAGWTLEEALAASRSSDPTQRLDAACALASHDDHSAAAQLHDLAESDTDAAVRAAASAVSRR